MASTRIDSLDGLRGLAVLFPFAHGALRVPGTWVSADVFFVLSGFFITAELRTHRSHARYFRDFYLRRMFRLLPVLVVAFIAAALLFWVPTRIEILYALSFGDLGNVLYPDVAHSLCSLWSIAIAIHFYLFWPLAVRQLRRQQLIWLCTSMVIAGPVMRELGMMFLHSFLAVYYLTPFRLDSLAVGALLALLLESKTASAILRRWSGLALAASGLSLAALVPFGFLQRNVPGSLFNAFGYSWLATISFFLICVLVLRQGTATERLFSVQPLVRLGTVSFGFYLYHPVAIWFVDKMADRIHIPHWKVFAILSFGLSFAASWSSFQLLEKPLLALGRVKRRSQTLQLVAAATSLP